VCNFYRVGLAFAASMRPQRWEHVEARFTARSVPSGAEKGSSPMEITCSIDHHGPVRIVEAGLHFGMRAIIGLLTRRAIYLVGMVDLSNKSRHGPSERRHSLIIIPSIP
jgi:hypothetical protein